MPVYNYVTVLHLLQMGLSVAQALATVGGRVQIRAIQDISGQAQPIKLKQLSKFHPDCIMIV